MSLSHWTHCSVQLRTKCETINSKNKDNGMMQQTVSPRKIYKESEWSDSLIVEEVVLVNTTRVLVEVSVN